MTEEAVDKELAFRTCLERGMVMVIFDFTHSGVKIPKKATSSSEDGIHLGLNYSRRFHMPGFSVGNDGIRATLTFGGRPHDTFVPWGAIKALIQGNRVVEQWNAVEVELSVEPGYFAAPAAEA